MCLEYLGYAITLFVILLPSLIYLGSNMLRETPTWAPEVPRRLARNYLVTQTVFLLLALGSEQLAGKSGLFGFISFFAVCSMGILWLLAMEHSVRDHFVPALKS